MHMQLNNKLYLNIEELKAKQEEELKEKKKKEKEEEAEKKKRENEVNLKRHLSNIPWFSWVDFLIQHLSLFSVVFLSYI